MEQSKMESTDECPKINLTIHCHDMVVSNIYIMLQVPFCINVDPHFGRQDMPNMITMESAKHKLNCVTPDEPH